MSGMSTAPKLLTTREVAYKLGICPRTVFTLRESGKLRSIKVGRNVRFRPEDVGAYLDHHAEGGRHDA